MFSEQYLSLKSPLSYNAGTWGGVGCGWDGVGGICGINLTYHARAT